MKKKILAIIMAAALMITSAMPILGAGGDNTGDDIFDANMYVQISPTEGEYTIGEEFSFKTTIYAGSLRGKTYTRSVTIEGPAEVSDFQYNNGSTWTSVDSFNVETTIANDVSRAFKVTFNEVGTYAVNYQITDGADTVYISAPTKYITITDTSYSVSTVKPEEPTSEPESETSTEPVVDPETPSETESETSTEPVVDPETPSETESETTTEPVVDPETPSETTTEPETTTGPTICPTPPSSDETTTVSGKDETTVAPATTAKVTAPGKAKIGKVTAKKKAAKKVKLTLKKTKNAAGYEVAIYKTKKNAKKSKKAIVIKNSKKLKVTVKSKKLKNKKTLYVKVRAYVLDAKGDKVYGKWSKIKKVKIK